MKTGIVYRGFAFELRNAIRSTAAEPSDEDHLLRIEGYAAVFDEVTDLGGFREVIRRGAFTKTLQESDQLALWGHDMNQPLARKSAGTLELREDDHGLAIAINMDARISRHVDAFHSIERRDVKGSSFGFSVVKDSLTQEQDESPLRELLELRLFEGSPPAVPAYEATELEARSVLDRVVTLEPGPATHSQAEGMTRDAAHRQRVLRIMELEA